jgi:arsenate reductase
VQLLKQARVSFIIKDYLKTSLTENEVLKISKKLGLAPRKFIRKSAIQLKKKSLENMLYDDNKIAKEISKHPQILERPIVIVEDKALVCRPPEKVLTLL